MVSSMVKIAPTAIVIQRWYNSPQATNKAIRDQKDRHLKHI